VVELVFRAVSEAEAGAKWQAEFTRLWPAYKAWYLSQGDEARPTYLASYRELKRQMPELRGTYEALCELAGGGDLAARFLSFYCPPPYLSGCSQAVWPGEEPTLVRNYDYNPRYSDALLLMTCWNGRRVIAMSDCLWGVVDGMNDAGLVVSLTFGGRRVVGRGFGVPLILRYCLEVCESVADVAAVLKRIPTHMAYNVTALDSKARHLTAYLSPDRETVVTRQRVATNHQERVEWHEHARATATVERERYLLQRLTLHDDPAPKFMAAFLKPPLYSTAFDRGFGTLYTAIYQPRLGAMELRWPGGTWRQSFADFTEGARVVRYPRVVSSQNRGLV
jgi:predicted choloylglycine hydrolase